MDLNFTQQPEGWVAEFELTADANLHIERDERGYMEVLQRSPEGGQYARVEGLDAYAFDLVNDLDLTAIIYPKYIKVVSAVLPTYAVVTSAGEVTEIKSQTKEIEVTANGTIDVTPDAGFAYLNSVKVKTNVPTSGEGGGSASSMEYFRTESIKEFNLQDFATLLKYHNEQTNSIFIAPTTFFTMRSYGEDNTTLIAVGIDFQSEYRMPEPFNGKLIDILLKMGFSQAVIDSIPRITEEEFYTL